MALSERTNLPLAGMLSALAGFIALQVVACLRAGVFEYPLDDVYIHLAMASKIAQGTYGVNAGEPASASSSILYPLLLLPFPNTEFQRYLPLFWNTLSVAGCGWVWGRIAEEARLTGFIAGLIVLLAPIELNISGVGFTGMEAAPHMLASLLIILGLWRFLTGGGVAPWLIIAAIAAPLLRYEGLALGLMAALVLFAHGERRAAAVIAVAAVGLVASFSLFLMSLGLPPLPGSILAKLSGLDGIESLSDRLVIGLGLNIEKPAGAVLGGLVLLALLCALLFPPPRRGAAAWILLAAVPAAVAHLFFGQTGWMLRYEPYIVLSLLGAILLASSAIAGRGLVFVRGIAAAVIVFGGLNYLPLLWTDYIWNPRAIHLQQAQMARFARDYLNMPVMVNDLGRVAWGNDNYVLDIWGLGSDEARRVRFSVPPPPPGWAGKLAASHGIRAAMIYDFWFAEAVGPEWVRVGKLTMSPPKGVLGAWKVDFYATDPSFAPEMRDRLRAFAPTLPEEAVLTVIAEPGT